MPVQPVGGRPVFDIRSWRDVHQSGEKRCAEVNSGRCGQETKNRLLTQAAPISVTPGGACQPFGVADSYAFQSLCFQYARGGRFAETPAAMLQVGHAKQSRCRHRITVSWLPSLPRRLAKQQQRPEFGFDSHFPTNAMPAGIAPLANCLFDLPPRTKARQRRDTRKLASFLILA